jgi:hypothetical protein
MAESADPGEMAARAAVAMSLRGIEERVAALETALSAPPGPLEFSPQPLTDAEAAEFKERFAEAVRPLTPDQIRQLLRECVTVVKPGEVLILRALEGWTPHQVKEVHDVAAAWLEDNAPGIKALVIPPFEIAVVPGGVPGAA